MTVLNYQHHRSMLKELPRNIEILDVGVGTGKAILENIDFINEKKIKIHGIDVDNDYICHSSNLFNKHRNIFIEKRDLFTITYKYDVILFSESFPVIPEYIMKLMIEHCKTILNPGGKIIFINNLIEKKQINHPFALIKPFIKYIPLVWTDLGRAVVIDDFENLLKSHSLHQE